MRWPRWWEVLLILLIVAIVAAILFPVFAQVKTGGKRPCLSNLKQLGMALLMYAADNDGRPPQRDYWMDRTEPYLKNPPIYIDRIQHCNLVKGKGLYGYALNAGIKMLNNDAKNAASVPLVYDSVNLARNASDLATSMPGPGRHNGGNFIAFADGHGKYVKSP